MNAKFEVHFETNFAEEKPCLARIWVGLSASYKARLADDEINRHYYLLDQPLTGAWGVWDESGYRYAETTFSAEDWEELTKRVQKFIAETRQMLTEVVESNRRLIAGKPDDYEAVYTIA